MAMMFVSACNDSSSDDGSSSTSTTTSDATTDTDDTITVSDSISLSHVPFIDTDYFDFAYGDTQAGERLIDSQYLADAYYNMDETGTDPGNSFGVNFADGRIKGYDLGLAGRDKTFLVIYVRDTTSQSYGVNNFRDNRDGTVTDLATGLMWMKDDSGYGMEWQDALNYCEDLTHAGYSDWRLPNAKELQSIVDYTRMPDATDATTPFTPDPAIDTDFFNITSFTNYNGDEDWGFFWSSTTHKASDGNGAWGAYVAFGRALGNMGGTTWTDVHGAGCQRSDPKFDDGTDYSNGHGPQGDAVYVYNYVRPVRYDTTVTNPTYVIVDTNQTTFWDNFSEINAPAEGEEFFGQDANYQGVKASYTDNGDGTVTDNNTGLMWQKTPDTNGDGSISSDDKYTFDQAVANAGNCTTGGYTDWRLPSLKELYSLMQFSGEDVCMESDAMEMSMNFGTGTSDVMGMVTGGQPVLDFDAGVDYLSSLGIFITATDLEFILGNPPPSPEVLASDLSIQTDEAMILMSIFLGVQEMASPMS